MSSLIIIIDLQDVCIKDLRNTESDETIKNGFVRWDSLFMLYTTIVFSEFIRNNLFFWGGERGGGVSVIF